MLLVYCTHLQYGWVSPVSLVHLVALVAPEYWLINCQDNILLLSWFPNTSRVR